MGKGPEEILLQGEHTEGPKAYERMLNINPSERCKLKPQWDTTSHQTEWPSLTNQQTMNAGEVVEKMDPKCTVGKNADWCSHCGKQYGISSEN